MKLRKNISPKPEMVRKVEVSDYDPDWENEFEKEAANLRNIFGENCLKFIISAAPPSQGWTLNLLLIC